MRWTRSSSRRVASGSDGSPSASFTGPTISVKGVRSSWLMLAMNMLLARVACSAASLARWSSTSMRLRSVMSTIMPSRPTTSPALLRSGTLLVRITISAPFSSREISSWFRIGSPRSIVARSPAR